MFILVPTIWAIHVTVLSSGSIFGINMLNDTKVCQHLQKKKLTVKMLTFDLVVPCDKYDVKNS